MTANTPRTRKAKGRALQDKIYNDLRIHFPDLGEGDIKKAIMGESGIDIKLSPHARTFFPYAVECKNTEKINVWSAISQCESNAIIEKLIPLLIIKRNHVDPHVILKWSDFLEMLNKC